MGGVYQCGHCYSTVTVTTGSPHGGSCPKSGTYTHTWSKIGDYDLPVAAPAPALAPAPSPWVVPEAAHREPAVVLKTTMQRAHDELSDDERERYEALADEDWATYVAETDKKRPDWDFAHAILENRDLNSIEDPYQWIRERRRIRHLHSVGRLDGYTVPQPREDAWLLEMINGSPFKLDPSHPQLDWRSKYDHVEPSAPSDEVVYDLDIPQLSGPAEQSSLRERALGDLNVVHLNNDGMFQEGQTADVVAIRVRSNDIVDAETILLEVEGPWFMLEITAQRPGRVGRLLVAVGDQVSPGAPLVELLPP